MELRHIETGTVITDSEFRALNSNTSFPPVFDYVDWGYEPVLEGPQPTAGRYQVVVRDGICQDGNVWMTKYVAVDMDDDAKAALDERQAKAIRTDRNARLAACDWTQLADSPETNRAAWADYRQALRDITKQASFPWEVTWPVAP